MKTLEALALASLLFAGTSSAQPNTAYQSGSISLPSVDETATSEGSATTVNQGRIGHTIPFEGPPGGVGPEASLALSYGGRAEGVAGAGFDLALPAIRARLSGRGGQPDYGQHVTWLSPSGEPLIERDLPGSHARG